MKRFVPLLALALIAGCSSHTIDGQAVAASKARATPAKSATSKSATSKSATSSATPTSTPTRATCADNELDVTAGQVATADTLRHVEVTFKNISSRSCNLFGYPDATITSDAGDVLATAEHKKANAAHHLTLKPGDTATATVESRAIDTKTGNACAHEGQLSLTAPGGSQVRQLSVTIPACSPTITSVD